MEDDLRALDSAGNRGAVGEVALQPIGTRNRRRKEAAVAEGANAMPRRRQVTAKIRAKESAAA
jgi:hypothetical protein